VVNNFWFEAKNINCFKNGFRVIKDLNLKIAYSENVILIGPNGSGKSSIIEVINRNLYPVVANESKLKIFDKELINIWELRNKISTVNNGIKNRINPNLQVFDLILSGLYGRYCYVQKKSEKDVGKNWKSITEKDPEANKTFPIIDSVNIEKLRSAIKDDLSLYMNDNYPSLKKDL